MKKKSKRNIPLKNYIIVLFIIIGIVFLTLYLFRDNEEVVQSDLYRVVYEIQYEELNSSVFDETTDDYFIYISYLDDNNVAKLEQKVKNIIVANDLQNNFYYLNATELKEDELFIMDLNNKLNLTEEKVQDLPSIIFYNNNKVEKVITSKKNRTFNVNELKKIIKEYDLTN